jgi:peptidylprolyl isomerase
VRKISALLVTAGLVATLTACASDPGYAGCGQYETGDASSIIDVAGEFGSTPKVDFPTPIVTKGTQATEVIAGEGERLEPGQPVRAELAIFHGSTGESLQSTPFDGNGVMTMVG